MGEYKYVVKLIEGQLFRVWDSVGKEFVGETFVDPNVATISANQLNEEWKETLPQLLMENGD